MIGCDQTFSADRFYSSPSSPPRTRRTVVEWNGRKRPHLHVSVELRRQEQEEFNHHQRITFRLHSPTCSIIVSLKTSSSLLKDFLSGFYRNVHLCLTFSLLWLTRSPPTHVPCRRLILTFSTSHAECLLNTFPLFCLLIHSSNLHSLVSTPLLSLMFRNQPFLFNSSNDNVQEQLIRCLWPWFSLPDTDVFNALYLYWGFYHGKGLIISKCC